MQFRTAISLKERWRYENVGKDYHYWIRYLEFDIRFTNFGDFR